MPPASAARTALRSTIPLLTTLAVVLPAPTPALAYQRPGTSELVSVASAGTAGAGAPELYSGRAIHSRMALSTAGRFVAFDSLYTTLVPGDGNNDYDVFVR